MRTASLFVLCMLFSFACGSKGAKATEDAAPKVCIKEACVQGLEHNVAGLQLAETQGIYLLDEHTFTFALIDADRSTIGLETRDHEGPVEIGRPYSVGHAQDNVDFSMHDSKRWTPPMAGSTVRFLAIPTPASPYFRLQFDIRFGRNGKQESFLRGIAQASADRSSMLSKGELLHMRPAQVATK